MLSKVIWVLSALLVVSISANVALSTKYLALRDKLTLSTSEASSTLALLQKQNQNLERLKIDAKTFNQIKNKRASETVIVRQEVIKELVFDKSCEKELEVIRQQELRFYATLN